MKQRINVLKTVSKELGIDFEEQDWGIINASPYRINEFIEYFNSNASFPETIKYQLFELIIASCNEAILEKSLTSQQESIFMKFIQNNSDNTNLKSIIDYWKKIADIEEFPVGKLL